MKLRCQRKIAVAGLLHRVERFLARPADVYAGLALTVGALFVIFTPPMAGADEPANFERAYETASLQWLGAEGTPKGLRQFIDESFTRVRSRASFTKEDWRTLRAIELEADEIARYDNPSEIVLRVHNPIAYLPYAPSFWLGLSFGLSPYWIFVLCRLTTLALGVALMRQALLTLPAGRTLACFVALSPTAVFYLSIVSIDAFLIGAGFLFFASIVKRLSDVGSARADASITGLIPFAVCFGVLKTPYAIFPVIAALLPITRFGGAKKKMIGLAAVTIPGVVIAIAWAAIVRSEMLGGITYATSAGDYVNPGDQLALILAAPWRFAVVLYETIATTNIVFVSLMDVVAQIGWRNAVIPPLWVYAVWLSMFFALWLSEKPAGPRLASTRATVLQLSVFCAILIAALLLLYLQWTAVGAATVGGFQGRYLLPLMPLVLFLAPHKTDLFPSENTRTIAAFAVSGAVLAASFIAMMTRYYG